MAKAAAEKKKSGEPAPEAAQRLLIVDDDPGIRSQLRWSLEGYEVAVAANREEAIEAARREPPQVVLLDLGMPPDEDGVSEGFATLEALLKIDPLIRVIVTTAHSEREYAVRAVALGAYDFCAKPVDIEILQLILDRAFRLFDLENESRRVAEGAGNVPLPTVITADPGMIKICRAVEQVASSDISVLITGESGTGKEVIAKGLHELSDRKKGPFVAINCAAVPEALLESELFGHEKGAFTGAVKRTIGKFEQANGGTIFLDEIAEMAMPLQSKLLRFLQDRSLERVGGRESISVDVRIVSATNKDLMHAMENSEFREDLYYRLNEVSFHLPPLRDRAGDAVLLANFFIKTFNPHLGTSIKGLSSDARAALESYRWPGNIRELQNKIKRAMVLCEGRLITASDLGLAVNDEDAHFPTLKQIREKAELGHVMRALALADSNMSQAAKLLGVSRPTLYSLVKQYGLSSSDQDTEKED